MFVILCIVSFRPLSIYFAVQLITSGKVILKKLKFCLVLLQDGTLLHKTNSGSRPYSEIHRVNVPAEDKNANVLSANQHVAEVYPNLPDAGGFSLDALQKLAPGSTIESVTLDKPDGVGIGLGFGIVGLRSESAELGVFIKNIQPSGVADK